MTMEFIKKAGAFLALFAMLIGAVCGIGMNFYHHEPVAGICCIILTIAAIPTAVRLFRCLQK